MPQHPPPPTIPRIDEIRCQVCSECVARKECRVKAIKAIDPGEPPFIDANLCYGCLICVPACPFDAVVTDSSGHPAKESEEQPRSALAAAKASY